MPAATVHVENHASSDHPDSRIHVTTGCPGTVDPLDQNAVHVDLTHVERDTTVGLLELRPGEAEALGRVLIARATEAQ